MKATKKTTVHTKSMSVPVRMANPMAYAKSAGTAKCPGAPMKK